MSPPPILTHLENAFNDWRMSVPKLWEALPPPTPFPLEDFFFLNYVRPSPIPIGALLGGLMSLILGGIVSKFHIEGTLEDMCSRFLRYIMPSPNNYLITYLGGGLYPYALGGHDPLKYPLGDVCVSLNSRKQHRVPYSRTCVP